jgi:ABC-type glycerol-3-phosphate transport system permease component
MNRRTMGLWRGARVATLALLLAFCVLPILWLVLTSFKTRLQIFASPPVILFPPSFESWAKMVQPGPIRAALLNSLATASYTTALTMLLATLAAYGFSRMRFRGRAVLLFGLLATRLLPPINSVVVLYLLFTRLRLVDSIAGLVLLYAALLVPIAVWLLKTAFDGVPQDIEEAAFTDGCGRLGALARITLPLAAPGLAVTAILVFVLSWNEFMFAYIFTSTQATTVPVLLAQAVGEYGIEWADLAAQATVLLVPVFLVTLFAQRHLISGLSAGAVK